VPQDDSYRKADADIGVGALTSATRHDNWIRELSSVMAQCWWARLWMPRSGWGSGLRRLMAPSSLAVILEKLEGGPRADVRVGDRSMK
jgi:hypothetical protein